MSRTFWYVLANALVMVAGGSLGEPLRADASIGTTPPPPAECKHEALALPGENFLVCEIDGGEIFGEPSRIDFNPFTPTVIMPGIELFRRQLRCEAQSRDGSVTIKSRSRLRTGGPNSYDVMGDPITNTATVGFNPVPPVPSDPKDCCHLSLLTSRGFLSGRLRLGQLTIQTTVTASIGAEDLPAKFAFTTQYDINCNGVTDVTDETGQIFVKATGIRAAAADPGIILVTGTLETMSQETVDGLLQPAPKAPFLKTL